MVECVRFPMVTITVIVVIAIVISITMTMTTYTHTAKAELNIEQFIKNNNDLANAIIVIQ